MRPAHLVVAPRHVHALVARLGAPQVARVRIVAEKA